MELRFAVPARCGGWRLRDLLRALGVTAQLSRAVKRGDGFFLDGQPVHANARVEAGQCLTFRLPADPTTSVRPQALPVNVVYEDPHAILLEKPAGMAVHPTRGYPDGTLANAYLGLLQARGQTGVFRPVSRLDRNTSGLVLCAKNAFAAPLLAQTAQKQYLALCEGEMPAGRGVIDAPIGLAAGSTVRRQVCPGGRPSSTRYRVLAAGDGLSLVLALPLTGRTHQIRVHLASLGHPLAGDDLYGGSRARIARHALHCARVGFDDPGGGGPRGAASPLPPDLAALCGRIPGAGDALDEFYAGALPPEPPR